MFNLALFIAKPHTWLFTFEVMVLLGVCLEDHFDFNMPLMDSPPWDTNLNSVIRVARGAPT
mgnify:FL=1